MLKSRLTSDLATPTWRRQV